jgi:hypothetical protein
MLRTAAGSREGSFPSPAHYRSARGRGRAPGEADVTASLSATVSWVTRQRHRSRCSHTSTGTLPDLMMHRRDSPLTACM